MPLRLEPIAMPDLDRLETGGPRLLPLDLIDEDPEQPRTEFDPEALDELAGTVRLRGVLQPVSVKSHPKEPGRWMLNFGSRRYRASKLASLVVIPAFVDESFDTYAQVIENEQREALQPMELALFVKKRRALGETQSEIGRLLGKSKSYVSFASALIDAPGWLMELYRSNKCRGLTELYQLKRLHERAPTAVEEWCDAQVAVSRSDVQQLEATLEHVGSGGDPGNAEQKNAVVALSRRLPAPADKPRAASARGNIKLMANLRGDLVEIITRDVPTEPGHVFVSGRAVAGRYSVAASELALIGFAGVSES